MSGSSKVRRPATLASLWGQLSGPPAEQAVYSRLRSEEDAKRIWQISERLTHTTFAPAQGA